MEINKGIRQGNRTLRKALRGITYVALFYAFSVGCGDAKVSPEGVPLSRQYAACGNSSTASGGGGGGGLTVPSAPGNLMSSAASTSQVNLTWTDNSSNENGFKIERKTGTSGSYSLVYTTASNATGWLNTGMSAGTTYYYRIYAYNGAGNSGYSSEATATTSMINLPKTGQITCYNSSGTSIACAGTGQDGELQRGVAWPSPRFTNLDGSTPISGSVVLDQLTGLMWTKDSNAPGPATCSPGLAKSWQGALDYVACLNTWSYLGYTDWRLPNRKELKSLINHEQSSSSTWLNSLGFNVFAAGYWSSSTIKSYTFSAWFVGMSSGTVTYSDKTGICYAWPVRAGGSAPANLPQTGQTTCYNTSGTLISCAGTGHDGDLKKGVGWPSLSLPERKCSEIAGHKCTSNYW